MGSAVVGRLIVRARLVIYPVLLSAGLIAAARGGLSQDPPVVPRASDAEALADQLLAAADPVERRTLLSTAEEAARAHIAGALVRRARRHFEDARFAEASAATELSAAVADELADAGALSMAFSMRSVLARITAPADPAARLELAERAVALAETDGEPDVLALSLLRRGQATSFAGRSPVADYERVLTMEHQVTDLSTPALAASELAQYHDDHGDHRAALMLVERTERLAEASGDPFARLSAILNRAGARLYGADFRLAARDYELAVELARTAGLRRLLPFAWRGVAAARAGLEDHGGASAAIREVLELASQIPTGLLGNGFDDSNLACEMWVFQGLMHAREGRHEEALDAARQSLRAAAVAGDSRCAIYPLELLAAEGGAEAAAEVLAALAALTTDLAVEPPALHARALALAHSGDRTAAYTAYRELIDSLERQRREAGGGPRERRLRFQKSVEGHLELFALLFADRRLEEAFEIAELSKARTLLETYSGVRELATAELAAEERERLRTLEARAAQAKLALLGADDEIRERLDEELDRARAELAALRALLHARQPAAAGAGPATIEPRALAGLLSRERAAVLEWTVTEEGVHVLLARPVAGAATGLRVRGSTLAAGPRELAAKTELLRSAVGRRDVRYQHLARELDELLLAPFAAEIAEVERLVLVPDGDLWSLPFAALLDAQGRSLSDRVAIFLAPSVTVWAQQAERRSGPRGSSDLLAVGNPTPRGGLGAATAEAVRGTTLAPLPDAEWEVAQIRRLYPHGDVLVREAASEEAVRALAAGRRVLHFATHGVFDHADPLYSHLVLAPSGEGAAGDGLLEAWEMMQLDLVAEVAILSACDTGRGEVSRGEGLVGMSWALLAAGVPTTIASLWQTDSEATALLMVALHRHLVAGRSPAEALRRAQLTLRRDPRYRHPYYWAPFVVVGDGG